MFFFLVFISSILEYSVLSWSSLEHLFFSATLDSTAVRLSQCLRSQFASTSSAETGVRGAADGRQPASAKPPCTWYLLRSTTVVQPAVQF